MISASNLSSDHDPSTDQQIVSKMEAASIISLLEGASWGRLGVKPRPGAQDLLLLETAVQMLRNQTCGDATRAGGGHKCDQL